MKHIGHLGCVGLLNQAELLKNIVIKAVFRVYIFHPPSVDAAGALATAFETAPDSAAEAAQPTDGRVSC